MRLETDDQHVMSGVQPELKDYIFVFLTFCELSHKERVASVMAVIISLSAP